MLLSMNADTFIVECSICQQAWEVPQPLFSAPGAGIQVPEHIMHAPRGGEEDLKIPCPGPQLPGLGLGLRSDWERRWHVRQIGRPLPTVFDGSSIRLAGPWPRHSVMRPADWRRHPTPRTGSAVIAEPLDEFGALAELL